MKIITGLVIAGVRAQISFDELYANLPSVSEYEDYPEYEQVSSILDNFDADDLDNLVGDLTDTDDGFDISDIAAGGRGPGGSLGLFCETCEATSEIDCVNSMQTVQCTDNQGSCFVEYRSRKGEVEHISMGCKDHDACLDQRDQNFVGPNQMFDQCKWWVTPSMSRRSTMPSVCRHCCSTERCFGKHGSDVGFAFSGPGGAVLPFNSFVENDWSQDRP